MTTTLHADLATIERRLGRAFVEELTYPGIYRGSRLNVTPVVIEREGRTFVVISEADSAACAVMTPGVEKIVYGRYFDWGKDMDGPVTNFAQAVRSVAGADEIRVSPELPVTRREALAAGGPVEVLAVTPEAPLFVHRKRRAEIEAQWLATRDADAARFAPFLATLPHGDRLVAASTARSTGYAPFDELAREQGLGAVCVTAPHEVEMFCGLPARVVEQWGIVAVAPVGSDEILVCSRRPLARADFAVEGAPRPLSEILLGLGVGVIGVQKDDMSTAVHAPLVAAGLALADCARLLRRWQDRRAGDDFVYFAFAANAIVAGITAARDFFARVEGDVRERDLVAVHHGAIRRFARLHGFEERISSYFDIVHSGARTLLPATAGDHPVRRDHATIKFDMGIVVADAFGCARAVSDIARTICADPQVAAMCDRLRATLVDVLIPAIRPGMSGEEVHAVGVAALKPLEDDLRAAKLLPPDKTVEGYRRDCGHTIQRQTISSVYFLPGVGETIEPGMLGCAEWVWPIGDVLIAVEDGWIDTPEGTIPFTAKEIRP